MKSTIIFAALITSGCASEKLIFPTRIPDEAVAGIWTSRQSVAVRSCISSLLGQSALSNFRVVNNDPKVTDYSTTIDIYPGASHRERQEVVNHCL